MFWRRLRDGKLSEYLHVVDDHIDMNGFIDKD